MPVFAAPERPSLAALPTELLLQIFIGFDYLDLSTLRTTCRTFAAVIRRPEFDLKLLRAHSAITERIVLHPLLRYMSLELHGSTLRSSWPVSFCLADLASESFAESAIASLIVSLKLSRNGRTASVKVTSCLAGHGHHGSRC
ncbi:hypothetical protein V8E36_000157 [Tilletia maclaganii]